MCQDKLPSYSYISSLTLLHLFLQAARQVLESLPKSETSPRFEFIHLDAGFEHFQKHGVALPEETLARLRGECQGALFGAVR